MPATQNAIGRNAEYVWLPAIQGENHPLDESKICVLTKRNGNNQITNGIVLA